VVHPAPVHSEAFGVLGQDGRGEVGHPHPVQDQKARVVGDVRQAPLTQVLGPAQQAIAGCTAPSGCRRGQERHALAIHHHHVAQALAGRAAITQVVLLGHQLPPAFGLSAAQQLYRHRAPGRREVPLVRQAVEALREQQALQARQPAGVAWRDERRVFASGNGRPWHPTYVERAFRRIRARSGVRGLPLHALRHSAAPVLLGAGVEPALAAKLLGHAVLRTFYAFYADLLRPAAQVAARQVEQFLDDVGRGGEWDVCKSVCKAPKAAVRCLSLGSTPVQIP